MALDRIVIKGASQHNLKHLNLEIPRDRLVVVTGLSGSGKSSLAFDTIYAEGQRRYVESLSAYARQFLEQMDKPEVESIDGLSPAISIEQKSASHNPRSTVGTITEIWDYLRLLFARVGQPHCPHCDLPIAAQTIQQMVDALQALPPDTRVQVLAPVVQQRKGEYATLFKKLARSGFIRARVNGEVRDLTETIRLDKYKQHAVEVVVDRLVIKRGIKDRLTDSVETACKLAEGQTLAEIREPGKKAREQLFSEQFACLQCGFSFPEISPRVFSFNSPYGACEACNGLGVRRELDPDLIVPDPDKSLLEGAVEPWSNYKDSFGWQMVQSLSQSLGFSLSVPFKKLPAKARKILLYGSGGKALRFVYKKRQNTYTFRRPFEGVIPNLERRYHQTHSTSTREEIERYMSLEPCEACGGHRLKPASLAVKINGRNVADYAALSVRAAVRAFAELKLTRRERTIAKKVIKEIQDRLQFLENVGLGYLALDRSAATLSGGEAQRIRLASQIGSKLTGVLYVLDEPSIGLHQRDNRKLLETLLSMRDLGNTVIVVEHDEETIRSADHVIDLGPRAGEHGGEVVAQGTVTQVLRAGNSLTADYLSRRRVIPVPPTRRESNGQWLAVQGAREHNLKAIDVKLPLGCLVAVTGVSGSGKSTLVNDILYRALVQRLHRSPQKPGTHRGLTGVEHVDKVILIDQSPIGRTPRSNPATYTNAFTPVRELFAKVPESKVRGYKPGRFSFNVKGGRCEACQGDGTLKIEMHFLPDIYIRCDTCKGTRYNRETLEIRYKGKSIADLLDLTVEEALALFENVPVIRRKLATLHDVGLGYIRLGQSATTLSGGEAQRVKLAKELSKRMTGRTLYVLDEPTTGLHFEDIRHLLDVLNRLVDGGNTVVIIEHNLDVIKTADYIIDLGPEGGDEGGELIVAGTPETVAAHPASHTGAFLRQVLTARD